MHRRLVALLALVLIAANARNAPGQAYGEPDRGEPGDAMIQEYLRLAVDEIEGRTLEHAATLDEWKSQRARFQTEYLSMLGLDPLPERTPLAATVTGTLQGEGFVVERLHYQSRPRLYVTANLYRPSKSAQGEKLPAVLYVCGHSGQGRNGNKTAFQSHGVWFARHGYVCLIVDTLQLGEIAAIHHGTYRENRWWWHSRGYTSAGVECWNGVRGIDYLVGRDDVDADRIAVTGISGGGAATFWIAAADERVRVAVPVSGMADLESYVSNRVINGHCDCMFLHNTYAWPWTRIAALVAPRPLLFVNSDHDPIFPMDANERIINRLERVYSLYGASDNVDSVVSIGGHAYRQDIRQAVFRFINAHLKGDARPVLDSEEAEAHGSVKLFKNEELRVFANDDDLPQDQRNTTIDEHFVAMASVKPPATGAYAAWRETLIGQLRGTAFYGFPAEIPVAKVGERGGGAEIWLATESGIRVPLVRLGESASDADGRRCLLIVAGDEARELPAWAKQFVREGDVIYRLEPRGVGATRWTVKNPPNYVARSHVLVGRTVDAGRVWDIAATAKFLRAKHGEKTPVVLLGEKSSGVLASYAALFSPSVDEVCAVAPPTSHMQGEAPQFLNVLRFCDIPDTLGLLAPRKLTVVAGDATTLERTAAIYRAAQAEGELRIMPAKSN